MVGNDIVGIRQMSLLVVQTLVNRDKNWIYGVLGYFCAH